MTTIDFEMLKKIYYYELGQVEKDSESWGYGVFVGLKPKNEPQVIYDPQKVIRILTSPDKDDYFRIIYSFKTRSPRRWSTGISSLYPFDYVKDRYARTGDGIECQVRITNYEDFVYAHVVSVNEKLLEKAISTYQKTIWSLVQHNQDTTRFNEKVIDAATVLYSTIDNDCMEVRLRNDTHVRSVGLDDIYFPAYGNEI